LLTTVVVALLCICSLARVAALVAMLVEEWTFVRAETPVAVLAASMIVTRAVVARAVRLVTITVDRASAGAACRVTEREGAEAVVVWCASVR
jgi:hypothetical protein